MKHHKVTIILLFLQGLCGGIHLSAQEMDTLRLNPIKPKKEYYQPLVLKISPTAFLWGGIFPYTSEYKITIEVTSGRIQSEQISLSVLDKNVFLSAAANITRNNLTVNGLKLQYSHKFYIISQRKFAPYGFYVSPMVSYTRAEISLDLSSYYRNEYIIFSKFDIDAVAGIQVGKFHRITLDSYMGFGYKKNRAFYHYTSNNTALYDTKDLGSLYNSSLNAIFGVSVGYSL